MSWKRNVLRLGRIAGAPRMLGSLYGSRRLTVLAYHRVAEFDDPGFDTDRRNVSADPATFREQMAYLARRFTPIGVDRLISWLDGDADLPERPALVTFDDGYRDNLTTAWPIMREHGVPGLLLLATDVADGGGPFSWDLAAWCFFHTDRTEVDLPHWGPVGWSDPLERRRVLDHWTERIKALPHEERDGACRSLPDLLGVPVPDDAFDGLYLGWDEVRRLDAEGFAVGAHTMTHPILTRIDRAAARAEIEGSAARIAEMIGRAPRAFAYPNGLEGDIDEAVTGMVGDAGFRVAFTLIPGPARPAEVAAHPLAIRRIYIHHSDHIDRFVAKVEGGSRVVSRKRVGRLPGRR